MVDNISSVGNSQSLANVSSKSNKAELQKKEKAETSGRVIEDKVEISAEALNAKEAEKAAQKVRESLERDRDISLGSNPSVLKDA